MHHGGAVCLCSFAAAPALPPAHLSRGSGATGRAGGAELSRVLTRSGSSCRPRRPGLESEGRRVPVSLGGARSSVLPYKKAATTACSSSCSHIIISWGLHRKSLCSCYLYWNKTTMKEVFPEPLLLAF